MAESFEIWLVALSLVVAALGSYAALSLASRIPDASRGRAWRWQLGSALTMGTAIWSMHFVGMLAFRLPIPLAYDTGYTIISGLSAVAASLIGMAMVSGSHPRPSHFIVGGLVLGFGVCVMHYTGMHALLMEPGIRYNWGMVALSALIAVTAAVVALILVFRVSRNHDTSLGGRLAAAGVMAAAIAGMHYTGMAAAHFESGSLCGAVGKGLGEELATWVAAISLIVLGTTAVLAVFDARLVLKTRRLHGMLDTAHTQLKQMALFDSLTQLPNRVNFEERLRLSVAEARKQALPLGVLFIDLDGFKPINDGMGHVVGDEVLCQIAERLQESVGKRGLVGRINGDEFVILIFAPSSWEVCGQLARQLALAIAQPIHLGSSEVCVTASIGIALMPEHDPGPRLLLKADLAMYEAKRAGRNTFRYYEDSFDLANRRMLDLVRDLRSAVAHSELIVHYQPKVRSAQGRMTGVEALLRWTHPVRGPISPAEFVPLAERFGLLGTIGEWTLREVCRQARLWLDQGISLPIAVNLSPYQLRDPELVSMVKRTLELFNVPTTAIRIEITEAGAMEDREMGLSIVERLSAAGLEISIDDFGTGYSSLSRLKEMPIRELKLDRQFLEGLEVEDSARAVVKAIVQLSHSLGLRLVAEGVETRQQAELLTELGCDELQGFYFSKAQPPQAIEALLMQLGHDGGKAAVA